MSMLPRVRNFRTVNNESFLFTTHPKTDELDAHLVFNHASGALATHGFKNLRPLKEALGPAEFTFDETGDDVKLILNFDNTPFELACVPGSISREMLARWMVNVNPLLGERVHLTAL